MITLHNYPKLESYILIDNNTYSMKETGDRYKTVLGIGGISEDGQVVGIYVQDDKLFFFYNGQSFETSFQFVKIVIFPNWKDVLIYK
ncbi:hypothetical protein [Bacillus pseudomycoides]|uniref:hypothetical protein n=1 Tax=Bacillus pseudomycoides TaxID=64104 RepID=UPI0020D214FB|nr:hypothetical protein [Bacillus pseudomycoides]